MVFASNKYLKKDYAYVNLLKQIFFIPIISECAVYEFFRAGSPDRTFYRLQDSNPGPLSCGSLFLTTVTFLNIAKFLMSPIYLFAFLH